MRSQPELKVYEIPVADLVPYANNAKQHTDRQIDTIVASMEEFGNCDPIAVWHNENGEPEIVEGHGRLLALRRLGIETCPVIFLDHLSNEQRRAYTHIHNQTTLNSGFDADTLEIDIEQLDFDWEDFGFDMMSFEPAYTYDEGLSAEELKEYESAAEEGLKSFNIIVSCMGEEEKQAIYERLGVQEFKRFYRAREILAE